MILYICMDYIYIYGIYIYIYIYIYGKVFRFYTRVGFDPTTSCLPCARS